MFYVSFKGDMIKKKKYQCIIFKNFSSTRYSITAEIRHHLRAYQAVVPTSFDTRTLRSYNNYVTSCETTVYVHRKFFFFYI